MKKDKQPSAAKAARKGIHESLFKALKSIVSQLEKQGIHTEVDLEKESKKLAKKITKGAKVDQPAIPKEVAPAVEVKAPAKEAAPAKAKPAAKPAEPKTEKAATPAPAAARKPTTATPKKSADKK